MPDSERYLKASEAMFKLKVTLENMPLTKEREDAIFYLELAEKALLGID